MSLKIIKANPSVKFDREWYTTKYPDVALSGVDPEEHYHLIGVHLGRQPNPHSRVGSSERREDPKLEFLPSFEWLGEHASAHSGPALLLSEGSAPELRFHGTLAIHVHLFHFEMLQQCRAWLASIPVPFDLFVSIADAALVDEVRQGFAGLSTLNRMFVTAFPNRGRDIGPMVVGFGPQLDKYDFLAHFHSKQSGHTLGKKDWAAQLGHHLFHSSSHVIRVLNLLADQPDLGLIFPVYHPSVKDQIKWGSNFKRIRDEIAKLVEAPVQQLVESDLLPFPAGSFFFVRTDAIRPLLTKAFAWEDFEEEAGQVDGTLAHAIERMIVLLSVRRGYTFQQIRAEKAHSLGRAYLSGDPYQSDFLDAVEEGTCTSLPVQFEPSLAGVKVTFFTCSTGGYDQPLPFENFLARADYIFFSDFTEEGRIGQWQVKPLAVAHSHQVKTARRHKTQPHRILETDIAIWIDGNIAITDDITPWVVKVINEGASFGVIPHPYRNSVRSEVDVLTRLNVDNPDLMRAQIEKYETEGFSDIDLTETNFIIMDLRRQETRDALDYWWNEIQHNSRRDQISFDYACWKAGARKIPLITNGLSVRADRHFAYFDHGGSRHPKLSAMTALTALYHRQPFHSSSSLNLSVDVVVCVHNSPDDVARCLHSLALARDGRTRIIIIDDGSDHPTQKIIDRHILRYPADRLVRHKNAQGYTKSANVGLKASLADYVILLNSDTIVPQGWVEALVRAGEADPKVGIIGPLSNAASWQSVPLATLASGDYAVNELPNGMTVDDVAAACAQIPAEQIYPCTIVNGFCFAIKRKAIDLIGYLDERAFPQGYGEENDYCLRLTDAGLSCGFTLSTYVYHAKSKSFNHERRHILSGEGWKILVAKHGTPKLEAAIGELRQHPALSRARTWFAGLTARKELEIKPIAFYLPQFHSIPVNDENWGAGFSEWRNVVKATPRFKDHFQPRLPGELGFYDLRTPETLEAQGNLAQEYSVYGMGIYYYRFGAERLMSAPTEMLLRTPGIGPRFFYVWANEDWTRIWDGGTGQIIRKQDCSKETLQFIADDLVEAAADSRYIRVDGRPVLMIYQLNLLPEADSAIQFLRDAVKRSLGIEIIIGTTWNPHFRPEWQALVDFIAQFPPHRTPRLSKRVLITRDQVPGATEEHADFLEDYDLVAGQSLEALDVYDKLTPGVCPDWDNSPRRSKNANILLGATPGKFEAWVQKAAERAWLKYSSQKIPAPFIFVNAWNEWAEGAVLEPTEQGGRAYLEALRKGLYSSTLPDSGL